MAHVTVPKIKERVEKIRERATWDDEVAHSLEDSLWEDVLEAIAKTASLKNANAFARAALETRQIRFARYKA